MNKVFPFTVRCCRDNGHINRNFHQTFLEVKDPKLTWYGADVKIHSKTKVTFIVYDLFDFVYGGLVKRYSKLMLKSSLKLHGKLLFVNVQLWHGIILIVKIKKSETIEFSKSVNVS